MQRFIGKFCADRAGGMAVIFALTLVIAVGCIGLAVDTGRAMNTTSVMRTALDAASLAAAKAMVEKDLTDAEIGAIARRTLQAQLLGSGVDASYWSSVEVDLDREAGDVTMTVDVTVPTTFGRVVNVNAINAKMEGKVSYNIQPSEVALVLDVTGSMGNDGRMSDMKLAAKEAVKTLLPDDQPHLNKVAIAPYAASVNAGGYAEAVTDGRSTDGCVVEREGAHAYTDEDPIDIPGGPAWLKISDDALGGPNPKYSCPDSPITPLTSARATLDAAIDDMTPAGWTGGHMGLAWGWYMISPKWTTIFSGASQPKPVGAGIKSIILMTDGDFNTSYMNGPMNETSAAQALALCENIKSEGIMLYTVGFAIDKLVADPIENTPAKIEAVNNMLSDCASEVDGARQFYTATDGTALKSAFQSIVGKIQSLRLTQ